MPRAFTSGARDLAWSNQKVRCDRWGSVCEHDPASPRFTGVVSAACVQVGDFASVPARMSLRAHLLGIRDRSGRALRGFARWMDVAPAGASVPSLRKRWPRSGGKTALLISTMAIAWQARVLRSPERSTVRN